MALARGSRRQILYVKEVTPGTTPPTPNMTLMRTTTDSLALTKETFTSEELRSDRQITDVKHGNKQAGGDIGIEFSYGNFDSFLESALFNAWETSPVSITDTLSAVAATSKITGHDFATSGVKVGDVVRIGGFTNAANNIDAQVTAVDGTSITLNNVTLVDETGGGDETVDVAEYLETGTTQTAFTLEKGLTDISQYQIFTGMQVGTMSLSLAPNAIQSGTMTFVGRDISTDTSSLDATPTDPNDNTPFDAFTGTIEDNGTTFSIVSSIDLTIENNLEAIFRLFKDTAEDVIDGRSDVQLSLSGYVEDFTIFDKFKDETESTLFWKTQDVDGNAYFFYFPRIKYNGGDLPVDGEGVIEGSFPVQALYDSTVGTNIKIFRLPVRP